MSVSLLNNHRQSILSKDNFFSENLSYQRGKLILKYHMHSLYNMKMICTLAGEVLILLILWML